MRMDQDDLDHEYGRLMQRSVEVGECRLPTKTRRASLRNKLNKHAELMASRVAKPADHDLVILCCDGKRRRAHQIMYMKFNSTGFGGYIPDDLSVVRTCKTPGCINGQHLKTQTYHERETLKKQVKLEVEALRKQTTSELRQRVKEHGLREAEVRAIYDSDLPTKEIADMYGVLYVTVYRIRSGETYSDITGHVREGARTDKREELTDEQVLQIRERKNDSLRKLAKEFGVSHVTISRIRNWKQRINAGFGE